MTALRVAYVALGALALATIAAACGDSAQHKQIRGASGGAGGAGGVASAMAGEASSVPSAGEASLSAGGDSGRGGNESSSAGAPAAGGDSNCPVSPTGKPPDDYLAQFESGTRIEARYFTAQGMPEVFAGFFDTQLDDWCDFMRASDDKLRCLPRTAAYTSFAGYSDTTCGKDVVTLSAACATVQAVYHRRRGACLDQAEIRELVPHTGPNYIGTPESCQKNADAAAANSFTLGAEVPPTTFAEGTLVELPGVCQASLRVVETADGARGPFEAFDIESGAGCSSSATSCRPRNMAYEEPRLFSDAACTMAATEGYASRVDAETCPPPDFVESLTDRDNFYRPGPLSQATLYSGLSGCEPARDKAWIGSIYELGELVAKSSLAPLQLLRLGSGRLRVNTSAEGSKPLIAVLNGTFTFFDNQLDTSCYLVQLSDSTLRCIPTDTGGSGLTDEYNDANCTQPVRRCQDDACVGKVLFDVEPDPDACNSEQPTVGIWEIKAQATAYYRMDAQGACYASGGVGPDMWTVEAVDPQTLAAATLQTAP